MELLQQFRNHVSRTQDAMARVDLESVRQLVDRLQIAYDRGQRVFIFGNGGSAACASHFAEDLAKGVLPSMSVSRRLRVQSLADPMPFLTALGNDCGYESVFREQLITHASPGDVVIAISGSGNSPNVLEGVRWAKENGLFTSALTGFGGGKLKPMVDLCVHAPVDDMEVAENIHLIVVHLVVGGLRARIAPR